ncbi:DNA polymerase II small subunit [archaeon]|nr:DNA polymerase II small subunit [archaeon]|tara:strand:+ start:5626 stop:6894 length:1269 start_codon:yes stop_codon:yes gene_type:complete
MEVIKDSWGAVASDYSTDITKGSLVGETNQKGTIDDIVNLFHNRYDKLKKVINKQCGFRESGTIKEIYKEMRRNKQYNIIGIVGESKTTKSGGKLVEIEDLTDSIRVFVRKQDPASKTIVVDDVIGVSGKFDKTGDMFWVDEVRFPDLVMGHQNKGGKDYDPVSIAFISDIHMGSKYFLEDTWDKMIKWMNEDTLAKNIKYLVLSGDCVDGVGVYPGQENNLSIHNVYEQYEFCARKLDELPDHITPIILPGNHDAVRPAEPQPVLDPLIQQRFNSAVHVGNPCRAILSGIDVLSYHGKGMDDLIPQMDHVTYETSIEGMKEMLKKRHLAPMWGERNALSPEEDDQLVIETPPDIFVTGHTHSHGFQWYRGVPLVVSSTMQGQTDFMNMLGYASLKGHLTLYNIQNRESKIISFHANDDINF